MWGPHQHLIDWLVKAEQLTFSVVTFCLPIFAISYLCSSSNPADNGAIDGGL